MSNENAPLLLPVENTHAQRHALPAFAEPPDISRTGRPRQDPHMSLLIVVLAAFACFALVFLIKQRQFSQPAIRLPYQLKQPFFSPNERAQLELLEQAVGGEFRILTKVRLADVVEVTAIPRRSTWYHATNRISAASFDFLLCDRRQLAPVCAVEIEEASAANAFLDELCEAIGLPLVRLTPRTAGSFDQVRAAIEQALARCPTTRS